MDEGVNEYVNVGLRGASAGIGVGEGAAHRLVLSTAPHGNSGLQASV